MFVKSVLLCALAHGLVARESSGAPDTPGPERFAPLLKALLGDAAAFQVQACFALP